MMILIYEELYGYQSPTQSHYSTTTIKQREGTVRNPSKRKSEKRTGIEREGEDDSYLAWNVGSEKSHFHLLSKFSILVCICGILLLLCSSD